MQIALLVLLALILLPLHGRAQALILNNLRTRTIVYEIPEDEGRQKVVGFIERFYPGADVINAAPLDDAALRQKLKGTFALYTVLGEDSRLLRLVARPLPLKVENGTMHWGTFSAPVKDLRVVFVGWNPYNEGFCRVYAAGSNALLAQANNVFHGPRSYHIFQGDGRGKLLREGFYDQNFVEVGPPGAVARSTPQFPAGAEKLRQKAALRWEKDRARYTAEDLEAIESIYQSGSQKWGTAEGQNILKQLVSKYPESNRAGCAILFRAQSTTGEEVESYLKTAVAKYSDSWYGDLVQVGAFARYLLSANYKEAGKISDAEVLLAEIRKDYPDAIDHSGNPLIPHALTPVEWRSDLAFLAKELPARHVNPFTRITKAEFEARVASLDAQILNMTEPEITTALAKLVASIGDGHTTIGGRMSAQRFLPLRLYWFQDGIYVTEATEQYRNLLGGKVVRVGNTPIEEACRELSATVSHENDAWLRLQLPWILMTSDILYGSGLTKTADRVPYEVQTTSGERVTAEIQPTGFNQLGRFTSIFQGKPPLYRANVNKAYWASVIESGATVYFQYNQCRDDPTKPFGAFRSQLREMLLKPAVQRLVVDLRNNSGGNSNILDSWIDQLKKSHFNQKDRLFVIVGRRTFSSAIMNAARLRNETKATFVGEPTGGKPNHFGAPSTFQLPKSHLNVRYSVKQFRTMAGDSPSLVPDVVVEETFRDYMAGTDPVLDAISRIPLPGPMSADMSDRWEDTDSIYQLAAGQLKQKNFKEAEANFRKLYEKSDARGLSGLAEAYGAQGQHDRAIQLLRSGLTNSLYDEGIRLLLADAAARAGKHDVVEEQLKILISNQPKLGGHYSLRLGETYRRAGDQNHAIECFRNSLQLNPTDPNTHVQLALLLEASGHKTEAADLYEKALSVQPDNAIALNNLAYRLAEAGGDLDRALAMARRAKDLSPQSSDVGDTLGWIYVKKNLNDDAVQIFRSLVAKNPSSPTFHYHYGVALLQKGDTPGAKRELEEALRDTPSKEDEGKIKRLLAGIASAP